MDFSQLVTVVQLSLLSMPSALLNHVNITSSHGEQRQFPIFQNGYD